MTEWWQVLIVATAGGLLGGYVVYHLSDKGRPKVVVWSESKRRNPNQPESNSAPLGPAVKERSRYGPCRGCGAPQDAWCLPACEYLDRWDWR